MDMRDSPPFGSLSQQHRLRAARIYLPTTERPGSGCGSCEPSDIV